MRFGLRRHTPETDRGQAWGVDQTGESDHVDDHQSALSNLFSSLPGPIPPARLTPGSGFALCWALGLATRVGRGGKSEVAQV